MAKNRGPRVILALVLFFLILLPLLTNGVDLLVDWLWFKQEGYRVIFTTILRTQIALSGIAGMGFMVVVGLNLLVAHAIAQRQEARFYTDYIEFPALQRISEAFRWVIWVGMLFAGYVVSHWGMSHWLSYLRARQVPVMGQVDPLFGIDLGFYLFQLPYTWF